MYLFNRIPQVTYLKFGLNWFFILENVCFWILVLLAKYGFASTWTFYSHWIISDFLISDTIIIPNVPTKSARARSMFGGTPINRETAIVSTDKKQSVLISLIYTVRHIIFAWSLFCDFHFHNLQNKLSWRRVRLYEIGLSIDCKFLKNEAWSP